jgi:hypothetical protein
VPTMPTTDWMSPSRPVSLLTTAVCLNTESGGQEAGGDHPGHSPSMLPIAAISLAGQVQSRSSSRVRSPCNSTDAVALRPQKALSDLTGLGQFRSSSMDTPRMSSR